MGKNYCSGIDNLSFIRVDLDYGCRKEVFFFLFLWGDILKCMNTYIFVYIYARRNLRICVETFCRGPDAVGSE